MERCERQVRTWIATQRDQEVTEIVLGITSSEITLLSVVKALGEFLVAEDGEIRGKGVELLSKVIERCPSDKVNRQSTVTLLAFYRDKLDDIDTVIPALTGMLPLTALTTFVGSDATETFKALVARVKMKSHVQTTRYVVFKIIDSLLARHRQALRNLGTEFIKGYISLADGEKDPRNLMLAFNIGRVILIEFDIGAHVEDLHDIYFCYFPITFKPPPNDPYGITTDDLKQALLLCLNATPLFGPLAIPLFMEKLSASSAKVKRDTLQALAACLPVYGAGLARKFDNTLWDAIKVEIFQPIDSETEQEALKTARSLIQTLYPPSPEKEVMEGLAVEICQECVKILKEPEKNQAQHAIKVISAFVGTTLHVSQYALSVTIPHLIGLFRNPDEAAHRQVILGELTTILTAIKETYAALDAPRDYGAEKPLDPYKDQVLGAYFSSLKSADTRKASLNGILQLVLTPRLLTDEELELVLQNINDLLESSIDIGDIRGRILDLLSAVSKTTPKAVEETTLPLLFSALPDNPPPPEGASERAAYQITLKSLSTLCIQPTLFETLVIRLSTKLDLVCHASHNVEDPKQKECYAAYAHAILLTLKNVVDYKVDAKHSDVPKYVDRLVPRLYKIFVDAALTSGSSSAIEMDPRLIEVAGGLVASIVSALTPERQASFAQSLFAAYQDGDTSSMGVPPVKGTEGPPQFKPLNADAPRTQRRLVPLFSSPLLVIGSGVTLPVSDHSQFLRVLLGWCLDHDAAEENECQAIFRLLASFLNKHAGECITFIDTDLDSLWDSVISRPEAPAQKRQKAIDAWMWLTRALLIRSHQRGQVNVDSLITLFKDGQVGWDAAKAIGEIGRANDGVLTKKNGCVVKLLHVQKYAYKVLPLILNGYKSSASDHTSQNAYLVALTSLIKHLPKSMYAHDLPALMPLLLRGLDLPDVGLRANVIDTLTTVAKEDSSDSTILADHVTSVINTLLKNCVPSPGLTSTKLRVSALRCLGILPNAIPYDVLHPHKPAVVRQLAKALDDPSREVRRMAVDTRAVWWVRLLIPSSTM